MEKVPPNNSLESRYKSLFQLVPVSIWEEDFSELKKTLNELKARGITDFKGYFDEHPDVLFNAVRMVKVLDVNDYSVKMFDARDKTELMESITKVFTGESMSAFKNAVIALAENKLIFECETVNQTIHGKKLHVLLKIRFPEGEMQLSRAIVAIVDITHNKEMEMSLLDATNVTSVLAGLASNFILSPISLHDICQLVLEYGKSLTDSTNGLIVVFDESNTKVKASVSSGFTQDFPISGNSVEKKNIFEDIISRKESCFSNNPDDKICTPEIQGRGINIKNIVHAPALVSDELVGHVLFANSPRNYDEHDLFAIEQIAHLFTLAIMNFRAEQKTRENEEKLRLLLDSTAEGIYGIDLNGHCTFCNPSALKMLGYKTENDVIGRNMHDLIHHSRPDGTAYPVEECKIFRAFRKGEGSHVDTDVLWRADGTNFYAEYWSYPQKKGGYVVGAVVAFIDITDRKKIENALRTSETHYRTLFQNMLEGFAFCQMIFDEQGLPVDWIYLEVNPMFEQVTGLKNIAGKRVTEAIPGIKETNPELFEIYGRVVKTGHPEKFEIYLKPLKMWLNVSVISLERTRFIDVFENITERKRAAVALEESEKRFKEMIELLPVSIFEADLDTKVTYANQVAIETFGYGSDDLKKGLKINELIIKEDFQKAVENMGKVLRGARIEGPGLEYTAVKKDGTRFPVFISSSSIIKENKPVGFLGFILDISDKKRVEETEARYRIMLENAGDMVGLLDEKMRYEFVNINQVSMLGYERQEDFLGKSALDFIHPEDMQKTINEFARNSLNGKHSQEIRMRHKSGNYIWFDVKGNSFLDKNGKKKVLVISRNISDSKRMKEELLKLNQELENRVEERTRDLKNAQEKLIRQEKLAAVGKISSTISHELRNPLTTISNSVYFLNMKLGYADEKIKKHIELIQKEVDRSRQIITDLLDFTRIKDPVFVKGNIETIIKEALSHETVSPGITIETEFQNIGNQIDMDAAMLRQAFLNIITNAIQAMPQGGKLIITTFSTLDAVHVKFKDTGMGIPKEIIPRLFEPLFTTKKSGIGLGLTLVKDIIDKHGGNISVESEVGIGTTFTIILPLTQKTR